MRKESGNILFLILLAVVLFAALSYAVTSSMRGGGKDSSSEKADTFAAQVIQAASLLENTMHREMLVDNIQEYGFDMSGTNSNSTANATCTIAGCKMFTGNGGQIALPQVPVWATTNAGSGAARNAYLYVLQIPDVGTSLPEVALVYTYLTDEVCKAFQRLTSSTDVSLTSYDSLGGSNRDYSGTLAAIPASTAAYGDTNTTLKGRRSFCHSNDASQRVFVYVLLAR